MASIAAVRSLNIHRPRRMAIRVLQMTVDTFFTLPGGFGISDAFFWETAGNAVSGGIDIGTTDGAADVLAALAVGANAQGIVGDNVFLKTVFSVASPPVAQLLYIHAHTAWNNAMLSMQFDLVKLTP